ncbi:MAG: ribonuclease T [Enterobacterales bacterium]|nr:ribonuclease T [Enterobacterales bacterium]
MAQRFRGYYPVVVDVETGGFNHQTDALLEIAAVCLGFNDEDQLVPIDHIQFNVEPFPGANLEQSALDFTGIDPHNPLRAAVDEKIALQRTFAFIRKYKKPVGCNRAILVGHNPSFDLSFLKAAVARTKLKRNPFHLFSTFDTATLGGLVYGQTVLAKACESAGLEFQNANAHSALYDAQMTAELFCTMVNRFHELGGWPPNDAVKAVTVEDAV